MTEKSADGARLTDAANDPHQPAQGGSGGDRADRHR